MPWKVTDLVVIASNPTLTLIPVIIPEPEKISSPEPSPSGPNTKEIEVPEWKDETDNASIFYSEPLTLEEKNKIFQKSNNIGVCFFS